MWLVPKVKLVVSIVLTALLTSVFLMVQVCLLESSCHRGLYEMVGAHKRALYRMTGSQVFYIDSDPGDSNTLWRTREANIVDYRNFTSTSFVSLPTTNSTNKAVSKVLTYEKPSRMPLQQGPNTSPPPYKVMSKSSYAMFQFFHDQKLRHHCRLPKCMDNLSDFDKAWYDYCTQKQKKAKERQSEEVKMLTGDCEFMRGEGRAPVALASLPGSGNTWIRGLLEKATGICTGSMYCDVQLREAGFNGEEIRSGSVLVVKTHKDNFTWTGITVPKYNRKGAPSYGAVILLLRNPYHALVAEWNRKESKLLYTVNGKTAPAHTLSVGPEHFGVNEEWNSFIKEKMSKWKTYIDSVVFKSPPDVPKLVVRYEDFQKDRVREVSRVLDFLHFPYSPETLSQRLEEDFNSFHRKRHIDFDPFTQSQKQFIDHTLRKLIDRLSARNSGETYGIEDYLRNTEIAIQN